MTNPHATVERSVDWLQSHLTDLARHDAWPQFASEVREIVSQLENVLQAGDRQVRGVRCLDLDCNAYLRQTYTDPRPCDHETAARRRVRVLVRWNAEARMLGYLEWLIAGGEIRKAIRDARKPCERTGCDQGGRRDTWKCPACRRTYRDTEYRRAVAQDWNEANPIRTITEIARDLGVPRDRVKKWITRGRLATAGKDKRQRALADVREARQLTMRGDVA